MNEIWYFFLALLVLPYLVVPILIRRNHYFARQPKLRAVLDGFLPRSVKSFFDNKTIVLAKLGFEPCIDAVSLDFGPHLRVFMRLFVEKKNSAVAICSSLVPDGKSEALRDFIEFASRYVDGHEISTHNCDLIGAPIEHRQKITTALPKIADVEVLFAIHESSVKQIGFANKPILMPTKSAELEFLAQGFQSDLAKQASLGCLELDKNNNCYRPTWAGAFLMGWYSMWPIGSLMRLWQRYKAKLKLRALERVGA